MHTTTKAVILFYLYIIVNLLSYSECVLPGAGSFEMVAYAELMKHAETVKGKAKLGE